MTREEFEGLIRDDIELSLEIMAAALKDAGVEAPALSALYLTGGSSRIPLVAELVRQRFGRADTGGDPKTVVVEGAAKGPPGKVRSVEKRERASDQAIERGQVVVVWRPAPSASAPAAERIEE